jgi:hypothetical protein
MNEVESAMMEPSGVVDLVKADRVTESGAAPPCSERLTFQSMADRLTLGLLASVIGAVLVFVSAFLTWSSTNSKSSVGGLTSGAITDTIGIDGHRLGGATLVLSIAALALVMVMLLPATKSYAWKILMGVGALTSLLAVVELFQIPATLHPVVKACGVNGVTCSFTRTIGPGVWFTLVAGILVAVGAYVHHIRPVQMRHQAEAPSPPPVNETETETHTDTETETHTETDTETETHTETETETRPAHETVE